MKYLLVLLVFFIFGCSSSEKPKEKNQNSADSGFEELGEDRFKEFRIETKDSETVGGEPKVAEKSELVTKKPSFKKPPVKKEKDLKSVAKKKIVTKEKAQQKPISVLPPASIKKNVHPAWKSFTPNPIIGEQVRYSISYMGITAGEVVFSTRRQNIGSMNPVLHFQLVATSSSYYSFIYRVKDTLDVYVNPESYLPLRYSLIQDESGKKVKDLQLFDHNKGEMHFFYKRLKKGMIKKINTTEKIPPYFLDLATPFYFIRGLDLKKGAKYKVPMVKKGKVGHLEIEVKGKQTLDTVLGQKKVIEVKLLPSFPTSKSKQNIIRFWLTDDRDRIPVKFQGESKIGPIKGLVQDYIGFNKKGK